VGGVAARLARIERYLSPDWDTSRSRSQDTPPKAVPPNEFPEGTPLADRIIIRRTLFRTPQPGGRIKSFSVGLLALAAVAAASYLDVGDFYAAGM
jgi:hypothetical protein